jgi:hypothetical protein
MSLNRAGTDEQRRIGCDLKNIAEFTVGERLFSSGTSHAA